jgi:hypothetical protein
VWVPPLFAEAKQWHGLGRVRLRGLANVNIEALLVATGQNLKRLLQATGWGLRGVARHGLGRSAGSRLLTRVDPFDAAMRHPPQPRHSIHQGHDLLQDAGPFSRRVGALPQYRLIRITTDPRSD